MLHIALVVASFSIYYRERACPLPIDCMEVSVVEEFGLDRLFPNALHYNGKNHPRVKKESRERTAPKSLFLSPSSTDYMILSSQEGDDDKRESQDFDVTLNLTKSQSADEGEGISVVSNKDHESFLSQDIQKERYHSSVFEEMPASQETTLSSLNAQQQDFRSNDFYRTIRALLERARSYPLLARKRGMEGTVLVWFTIDRKGLPQDVKIMKSSGYQILDEEVKKMLRKASPFPEFKGEIKIPITFKLGDSISNR